ncbi:MAG: NRDE family protein [Syntrophomonadaceae bacterium]|nr:NRDE family protein [Syntrophomonadaceae bacterium]
MCLIIFAYDYHSKYKLVVAANRDEFYERPTVKASFWKDEPTILAGQDLKEGGTWLGVNTDGHFAALTNYRDPSSIKDNAPSRGQLVKNYLISNLSPTEYMETIPNAGSDYNGFNLLLGDKSDLYYLSNQKQERQKLSKGVYGLSNSLLNVKWPKVTKGIDNLTEILSGNNFEVNDLFNMMADRDLVKDEDLPNTGVGMELERILAPAFVVSPNYGTSLTTVLLMDYESNVKYWERTFINQNPNNWEEAYYEIAAT